MLALERSTVLAVRDLALALATALLGPVAVAELEPHSPAEWPGSAGEADSADYQRDLAALEAKIEPVSNQQVGLLALMATSSASAAEPSCAHLQAVRLLLELKGGDLAARTASAAEQSVAPEVMDSS